MPTIKAKGYSVVISNTALKTASAFLAKARYSGYFILCDENTLQECLPFLINSCPELARAQIIEIESGEASKAMTICEPIWQTLIENQADRRTLLINLGGGVVSDLGGFIASVYKRGIDFINIPTSLLAMADASVGGKTGIDFYGIKNVIGSFACPKAVFVNPGFLSTLPEKHYQNGLAEVFKIALVSNKVFWNELRYGKKKPEELVTKSIILKNNIVLRDPFDQGRRKMLNFGHTIGHAIEALTLGSAHELLHGEAVLAGMIMESHLAFQKKLIPKTVLVEVSTVLRSAFTLKNINGLAFDKILDQLGNDKKTIHHKIQFALITGIGTCRVDVTATAAQIKKAVSYYNQLPA